ncbi:MAG: cytochrome P450 [Thermaceae bacterium]|nr:cytochrome P450 [Thermaceae bacterium]
MLLEPAGYPTRFGHLPRWAGEPLKLLEEGAKLGSSFGLRLGRRAVVGYSPQWNRMLLSDLETFRSGGSFSSLTPYLSGGIITADVPEHRSRRQALDPSFHAKAVRGLRERLQEALQALLPRGEFEARAWASQVALTALNVAYFDARFPLPELAAFLAPLNRAFPAPLLPRPLRFASARHRTAQMRAEGHGMAAHLPPEEVLVGLAAGYDTTAHTLAWALWHAANYPQWHTPEGDLLLIKETLRLYPPGFVGSRRAGRGFEFAGKSFPAGVWVLYSSYLTHRDKSQWERPLEFNPLRFTGRIPAWGYLPFGGGERICLGMHFAQMVLEAALSLFGPLQALRGDPSPKPLLTLAPRGELWLRVRAKRP